MERKKTYRIPIQYMENKKNRQSMFTKKKETLFSKCLKLHKDTQTEVFVLVVSEKGTVYTFATPKVFKPYALFLKDMKGLNFKKKKRRSTKKEKFVVDKDE